MRIRQVGWGLMMVFASIIAIYALMVLLVPGFGPPFVGERRTVMPWAVIGHLAGGLTALAIGPWQLNTRLRQRAIGRHRWMGRVYVVAVAIGSVAGLALAPGSLFGLATHIGFGLLAGLWLTTTMLAWLRIRAGDRAAHRRWMIRSYALTLAAVTLRIWLPLSQIAGIPFPEAYQVVSWLCWVPNLVVAEWIVLPRVDREVPV